MKKRIVSMVSVWMLFLSVLLGAHSTIVAAAPQFVAERVIIYDNGHRPYVDELKAASFIDLMREYGTVQISRSTITPELLRNATLLVIPNPLDTSIHTAAEIEAIKDYVENGGALFIMATYYVYFDPDTFPHNKITGDYGIKWVDGSNNDINDNDGLYPWFVLFDTFPNNELANTLKVRVENIKMSGTALNITVPVNVTVPVNTINVTVYPIVTGDDDPGENRTVTYDADYNVIYNGTDVIPLAGVELDGGGRIIASGSDYFIRSDNPEYSFFPHNEVFLRNMLDWLLRGARMTFGATVEETTYWVTILGNFTVEDFNFSKPDKQISFNFTGADGFCYVNIPKYFLDAPPPEDWTVQLDDSNITDFTITVNERINYTFIYFTYTGATHEVIIKGTWVVPEFPAWALTLLMLSMLAVSVALLKRKIQRLS